MAHLLHIDASPRGKRSHSCRPIGELVEQWQQAHPGDTVTYRDIERNPFPHVDEPWIAAAFTPLERRTPDLWEAKSIEVQLGDLMIIPHYLLFALKLFAALGCGLVAGVFFAFSTFVMSALARLQPAQGIAAMQSINITVINLWFMTAFLGTGAVCLLLAISSLLNWHQSGAIYILVGSLLYLVGTVAVTIAFNVPLNDALAIVKPDSTEGINLWNKYLTNWTIWNHIRTIAALVAGALLTIALCDRAVQY